MPTLEELKQDIANARSELIAELDRTDENSFAGETPNPGWTLRDLLAHLSSTEVSWGRLIQLIHAGKYKRPDDWDINRWNEGQVGKRADKTVPELRQEMEDGWRSMQESFQLLNDSQLDDTYPPDPRTLAEILQSMARHYRTHMADVKAVRA